MIISLTIKDNDKWGRGPTKYISDIFDDEAVKRRGTHAVMGRLWSYG